MSLLNIYKDYVDHEILEELGFELMQDEEYHTIFKLTIKNPNIYTSVLSIDIEYHYIESGKILIKRKLNKIPDITPPIYIDKVEYDRLMVVDLIALIEDTKSIIKDQ